MENNHNLIYSFLSKYNLTIEEHYGLAAIGLCKAAKTYKDKNIKFSTYAYKCMFNEVMCELRKDNSAKRIPRHQIVYYQAEIETYDGDTESFLNFIPSNEDIEADALSKIMLEEYLEPLKKRDKQILLLFEKGYKQQEISKIVGCSQPQVSRVKRKTEKILIGD